jgi:hypothetical protein
MEMKNMRQWEGRGLDESVTLPPVLGDCPTNHSALPEGGVQVVDVVVVVVAIPVLLSLVVGFRILGPSSGAAVTLVIFMPRSNEAFPAFTRAVDMRGPAAGADVPKFATEVAAGVRRLPLFGLLFALHVACAGVGLLSGTTGAFFFAASSSSAHAQSSHLLPGFFIGKGARRRRRSTGDNDGRWEVEVTRWRPSYVRPIAEDEGEESGGRPSGSETSDAVLMLLVEGAEVLPQFPSL